MALFNDKSKKDFRRALRSEPTYAERALWAGLRGIGVGAKFRRQESIGPYVVDFYCPELMLAIEVDGASHRGRENYAHARDEYLALNDIIVMRFSDEEVLSLPERVHSVIRAEVTRLREVRGSNRKPTRQLSRDDKTRASLGLPIDREAELRSES